MGVAVPPVSLEPGVRCDSCSLWPSSPCIGAVCPVGQYPTTGSGGSSGSCLSCPPITSCAPGFYLTGCLYGLTMPVCASCPALFLLEDNPNLINTRQWAHILVLISMPPFARPNTPSGFPTCILVCAANHVFDGTQCSACPSTLYSIWNASVGVRWWVPSLDAQYPWLQSRPSLATTPEQRAGLCWPCPPWAISVFDLCDTNTSRPDTGSMPSLPSGMGVDHGRHVGPAFSVSSSRRRSLLHVSATATATATACSMPGI